MMGMMHVDVDEEGYLLVNHAGETSRFVETDLGVYENIQNVKQIDPFGTFSTIVFGKDPHGNTLLMTDGPMSYSKAPWRSEEHTSELQSRGHLVCRLLLEKNNEVKRDERGGAAHARQQDLRQHRATRDDGGVRIQQPGSDDR